MSHEYWLGHLKREHEVVIDEHKFFVYDYPTSESVPSITKECRMDLHKIKFNPPPNSSLILDLGANIGVWSIWVAKMYPGCVVVPIEPMPHNFDNLVINIERSGCTNILPLRAAVWSDHKSDLVMGQHPLNSGSASIEFAGHNSIPQFHVMAHPLDFLIEKFKPSFTKVDIEGAEYAVMAAVKNWDAIGRISIDMHNVLGGDLFLSMKRKTALIELCKEHLGDRVQLIEPFDIELVDVPVRTPV